MAGRLLEGVRLSSWLSRAPEHVRVHRAHPFADRWVDLLRPALGSIAGRRSLAAITSSAVGSEEGSIPQKPTAEGVQMKPIPWFLIDRVLAEADRWL